MPGHVIAESTALMRKWSAEGSQLKGVSLIKTVQPQCFKESQNEEPDPSFKPFIFDGIVSLTGELEDERAVEILRHTGGCRSMILSDVLPLIERSSCHASILVQGVEIGYVPAPLHCLHVRSNLVSGFFTVPEGVRPAPEVTEVPEPDSNLNELCQTYPTVLC